jgi:predicted nuclease with RNAse H fold
MDDQVERNKRHHERITEIMAAGLEPSYRDSMLAGLAEAAYQRGRADLARALRGLIGAAESDENE